MPTRLSNDFARFVLAILAATLMGGCGTSYPRAPALAASPDYRYVIGPGDTVNIVVFRNPELSMVVPVRPDGKIAAPLVEDLLELSRIGRAEAGARRPRRARVQGLEREARRPGQEGERAPGHRQQHPPVNPALLRSRAAGGGVRPDHLVQQPGRHQRNASGCWQNGAQESPESQSSRTLLGVAYRTTGAA